MTYTVPNIDKEKVIYRPPVLIKEGTVGHCPYCGSTIIKRWIWFGKSIGCIQEACKNYYKRLNK